MENLKDKLADTARKKGICREGYERILRGDRDNLIDYYLEVPDWCLERNFPDMRTLTDEFADCEDRGVFVGKTFHGELLNDLQTYIFHNCKGTIKVGLNVDKSIIPMLYMANGCRMRIVGVGEEHIKPKDHAKVPIYIYGRNDLSARNNRYVEFKIFNN